MPLGRFVRRFAGVGLQPQHHTAVGAASRSGSVRPYYIPQVRWAVDGIVCRILSHFAAEPVDFHSSAMSGGPVAPPCSIVLQLSRPFSARVHLRVNVDIVDHFCCLTTWEYNPAGRRARFDGQGVACSRRDASSGPSQLCRRVPFEEAGLEWPIAAIADITASN